MATIDWCVTFGTGGVGRILNWRPMVFAGTLSYSLYLWQQLFLNRSADGPMSAFPMNVALAGALALASYYLIERPALRLRRRLHGRWRRTQPASTGASERRQSNEEHVLPEGALRRIAPERLLQVGSEEHPPAVG